jgi:hypothetical protein
MFQNVSVPFKYDSNDGVRERRLMPYSNHKGIYYTRARSE